MTQLLERRPPAATDPDDEWCSRCGYSRRVHWATDPECPDDTTARERWGERS